MKKCAFTLAEILSVLVILGLVATLVVPTTLKNIKTRENKTKLRKAMAIYEESLSKYFIEGDYNAYLNEDGRIYEAYNNEWKSIWRTATEEEMDALDLRYENMWEDLDNRYINQFKNKFNIRENFPDSNSIFITADGTLWYLGESATFSSVVVVPDRDFIKDIKKSARNNENIKSKIVNAAKNMKDNRAFYFVYDMPKNSVTPTTNSTYGKNFESLTIFDIKDNTTNEITNILRMQKLYTYLYGKSYTPISEADRICTSSSCCIHYNTGTCLSLKETKYNSRSLVTTGTRFYNGANASKYYGYDADNKLILTVDYDNREIKYTRNGVDECYTYNALGSHTCSIDFNLAVGGFFDDGTTCCMAYCNLKRHGC